MDVSWPRSAQELNPLHPKQPPKHPPAVTHTRFVSPSRKIETNGHDKDKKRNLSPVTVPSTSHEETHEQLIERNRQLAFEIECRDVRIRELVDENITLKENELELCRLLDCRTGQPLVRHRRRNGNLLESIKKSFICGCSKKKAKEVPVFMYVLYNEQKTQYVILECRHFQLSKKRANTEQCQVRDDGKLINRPIGRGLWNRKRMKEYWGTCTTSSIFVPPPTFKQPYPGPQYWETEVTVEFDEAGQRGTIYEVGLVEKKQLDTEWRLYGQTRAWCIALVYCYRHEPSICMQLGHNGRRLRCMQDSLLDIPGKRQTLRHGILVDIAGGKVVFLDLDNREILTKGDTVFEQDLYPVFGVRSMCATVTIKIISGRDICMTEDKQRLVYKSIE